MINSSILLIDDEEKLLETISDDLTFEGYSVITAANGKEGIKKFKNKPCALVITDMVMKGMDGLEVSRAIKKLSPRTEVIILTGYEATYLAVDALKLDVYDFILKPCNNAELMKTIAGCICKIENNGNREVLN